MDFATLESTKAERTTATVRTARLTLYHLDAPDADWNLVAELEGAWESLCLSGTAPTPVRPGPVRMRLDYIDAPEQVSIDGVAGGLTNGGQDLFLQLTWVGGRARIQGRVTLAWAGDDLREQPVDLELDVEAEVDTR